MPPLRLIDGGYRYPGSDRWIFRHVQFQIDPGEAVRVSGRNGSGKTTFLKTLAGILPLGEGKIEKSNQRIAYMDQFAGDMLAHDLTIYEHLKMASSSAISPSAAGERLAQFDLGLSERLTEFVGHLSGGQRQVVALLSTVFAGAHIVCLDEFTASMDTYTSTVAANLLRHARANATALIIVSHQTTIDTDREFSATENGSARRGDVA